MKKKMILSVITATIVLSSGMTVFAEPELIEVDGQTVLFDSEYYAENNADVTAVYGTDKNALARHYVTAGISEGRLPYAPGTDINAYRPVQEKKVLKKVEDYNPAGTLCKEYFYDDQGNLIRESTPDGSVSREYAYDSAGNQISEIGRAPSSYIERVWRYDSYGNMIFRASRTSEEKEMTGFRWEYEYDSQGRKIKRTELDGNSEKIWTETEYSYETLGGMNIVRESRYRFVNNAGSRYRCLDGIEEYVYDNNGNEIKHAMLSAGKYSTQTVASDLYQSSYNESVYDSQGNLIRRECYTIPLFGLIDTHPAPRYDYNLDTKMLVPASSTDNIDDVLLLYRIDEYSYDSWGNLIRLTCTQLIDYYEWKSITVYEYDYDDQGNMIRETPYAGDDDSYHGPDDRGNYRKQNYKIYIYE